MNSPLRFRWVQLAAPVLAAALWVAAAPLRETPRARLNAPSHLKQIGLAFRMGRNDFKEFQVPPDPRVPAKPPRPEAQ